MRALVDEQLPVALARWIEAKGHPAEHAFDVGLSARPDHELIRYAAREGAVIFTKDEDFVAAASADPSIRVVWIRYGNVRNRVLMAALDAFWPELLACVEAGERLIEAVEPR